MDNTMQPWELRKGMDVIAADGDKVGEVEDARGEFIVVKKGFLFPSDYYIPAARITDVNDDGVHLSVTKEQALQENWRQPPDETAAMPDRGTSEGTMPTGNDDFTSAPPGDPVLSGSAADLKPEERNRAGKTGSMATDDQSRFEQIDDDDRKIADDNDTFRVPLVEEELTATRRPVDRGTVRIEKDVVKEERSIDVPVMEEEVQVTPRTASSETLPDDYVIHDDSIEVPVRGEEVDVEKRARVTGELDVTKRKVKKTRHVSGTVRREEAHLADDSGTLATDQEIEGEGTQPTR